MKKYNTIIIIFLLLISTITTHAQPSLQWGARGGSAASGSGSDEEIYSIKTDAAGNVYVLGEIDYSLGNVDGVSGLSTQDQIALASWDCEGNLRWVKFFRGSAGFGAMEIDTLGGIYIIGAQSWSNSMYLDSDTMIIGPEYPNRNYYLVKYNTDGELQWVNNIYTNTTLIVRTGIYFMDCDQNGDTYLLGNLQPGTYESGAMTISDTSIQILKYNKDGVFQSHHPMDIHFEGGTSNKYSLLFNANFSRNHNNGKYYLAGYAASMPSGSYGDMYFGEDFMLPGTGTGFENPAYISSWDSAGNHLWAYRKTGAGNQGIVSKAIFDEENNVYVCGAIANGDTLAGYVGSAPGTQGNPFVIKLNQDGELIWGTNAVAKYPCGARGADISNNSISVIGKFLGYNPTSGTAAKFEWGGLDLDVNKVIGFAQFNAITGTPLVLDGIVSSSPIYDIPSENGITAHNGHIYIGAEFASTAYVGSDTLSSIGGKTDWLVARYGAPDCDCSLPNASFSYTATGTNAYSFTYTGSTPVDSVRWEFGDGTIVSGLTASHTYSTPPPYTPSIVVYNSCGIVVDYRHITGSTGIDGTEWTSSILIYPNPTKDYFTVEGAGIGTEAVLYNTLGQAVITKRISELKESINVTSLPAGVYVIHFTTPEGKKGSVKVVLEK